MLQVRRWETGLFVALLFFILGWSAFHYGGRYLHVQVTVQVATAVLLLYLTCLLWRARRVDWVLSFPLLQAGLFWLLVLAISWIFSVNQLASLEEILRLAMYISLTLAVYLGVRLQARPERMLEYILAGVIALGCLVVLMGWWLRSDGQALSSTFYRTNDLAGYLLLLVPLSLHLALQNQLPRLRFYYLLAFAYLFSALLMTNSRSSWLAGGLALGLVLVFNRHHFRQRMFWLICVGTGLAGGLLLFWNAELIGPRLQSLLDLSIFEESAARWRKELLVGAWQIFQEHSLIGTGPNTYAKVLPAYQQTPGYYSINPHNYYLQTLAEVGVLGLLGLGLWLSQSIRQLWQAPHRASLGILAALSASLMHIAFDIDWSVTAIPVLFFVLLGLGLVPIGGQTDDSGLDVVQIEESAACPQVISQRITAAVMTFVAVSLGLLPILNLASAQAHAQGLQALEQQPQAAMTLFEKARRLAPWPSARHYYSLGRSLLALQEPAAAYQMALRAIELDAYNGEYYGFAGDLLLQLDQPTEALALLLRRQELNPYRYPEYYTRLGDVYLQHLQQPQEALKTYLKGVAAFPVAQLARYERYLPQHRYELFNLYQKLAYVSAQLNLQAEAEHWQLQAQNLIRMGTRDLFIVEAEGHPYPVAALKAYWDEVPAHLKASEHRFESVHPDVELIPPPPWPVPFEQLRFLQVERELMQAQLRYAIPRQDPQADWIMLEDHLQGDPTGWKLVARRVIEP